MFIHVGLRSAVLAGALAGLAASISCFGAASAQEVEKLSQSPLSFRIGSAEFTPGGFVDFENVFRRTGSSQGTNFFANPYVAFKVSQAWGRWDCATNAANAPQACADPFTTLPGTGTNRLRLYWLDLKRGKWEFLGGQTWGLSGSVSAGFGGTVSNTQIITPFSTLRTHATGAMIDFNAVLNTPFLWINGTANLVPAPLLDGPGTFTETAGGFTDFGRLSFSRIAGATIDVGAKPLSFVVPPIGFPTSVFTGAIISPFAGYSVFNENLVGNIPGSRDFLVNSQNWQYLRIGAKAEAPLNLNLFNSVYNPTLTVSGAFNPWVLSQTANFNATGTGFQLEGNLSFPLNSFTATPNPALNGFNLDFFAKYSSIRASGDTGGLFPIPISTRNENTIVGTNFRILFGDTVPPPPPPPP